MTHGGRVVIVGAGVTGVLAAVGCARAGHRVTLLDRGAIPNPAASSWDQHRALRALDPADPAGTLAAASLHDRWLALESLLGDRFYRRVGVVTAWPADHIDTVLAAAEAAGLPVTVADPDKLRPIAFPAGSIGVLESDAGVLLADRVLRAATRWLAGHRAVTLRPHSRVTAVDVDRARVTVAGEELAGDLVLLAAGPWSADLVDLPMVLHRQTMVYLRPPAELSRWWRDAPSVGGIGTRGDGWLLPPDDATLLKISSASACRVVERVTDPDRDETTWVDAVLAAGILADADRYQVVGAKRCHYLVDARTGGGRLVRVGPAVWARAASGGDGFRTAPTVADRIVAVLACAEDGPDFEREEQG